METVDWTVSWATDVEVGVCCGVANGIHLAAFPIAIAAWRREGVGRGRGYQRQVDSDADESVVKAIRGAVERSERPFGWPSLGQSLTSSDLVLVVIPRKEGDQCAPYSLGVGPINCSQNPLPPTRAWCLVPVSPVIPVPATPCLAKTPVTRV
jgi:hypothetical protein